MILIILLFSNVATAQYSNDYFGAGFQSFANSYQKARESQANIDLLNAQAERNRQESARLEEETKRMKAEEELLNSSERYRSSPTYEEDTSPSGGPAAQVALDACDAKCRRKYKSSPRSLNACLDGCRP